MTSFAIEHFFDRATSTLSYLVFDPVSHDAVVIDPVLDFDPASGHTSIAGVRTIADAIAARGFTLHAVIETHAHADHLSGSQYLKRILGAAVMIGEGITEVQQSFKPVLGLADDFATDGSQFERLLRDGERLRFGALEMTVLATPGHTPACSSYLFGDAVFTGDALFMEDSGTGRCDFPKGDAAALYHSVHDRLYALPDETRVFVGHDYQPNARPLAFETTIGRAKRGNVQLQEETRLADFVKFRTERDRTLGAPRLLFPSVQVNVDAGRLPRADALGRRLLRTPLNMGSYTLDDGTPS